ncbi:GNAT family N-acetyltransferase [Metabacillus sp. HB246100]
MPYLETERLLMITFTAEMMEQLLCDRSKFINEVPFEVADEFPLEVYQQFFPYKVERFKKYPHENEWEGIIVLKEENKIIGDMGFKGGPDHAGVLDIGYSIVPEYRGRGFATEMGKEMVRWGFKDENVKTIIATSNPENIASKKVLEKIGFQIERKTEEKIMWVLAKDLQNQ